MLQSGTGKTTFFKNYLLPNWTGGPVYIHSKDLTEFPQDQLLPSSFTVAQLGELDSDCLVFFDDYQLDSKTADFKQVVNFKLTHERKSLVISLHDVYKSNLYSDICQGGRFFLTYCPASLKLLQILDKAFQTQFRAIFQIDYAAGVFNKNIAYLNTDALIFLPKIDEHFNALPTTMFKFDQTPFAVHLADTPCGGSSKEDDLTPAAASIDESLALYPKWQKKALFVLKQLRGWIDTDNCLIGTYTHTHKHPLSPPLCLRYKSGSLGLSKNVCEPRISVPV